MVRIKPILSPQHLRGLLLSAPQLPPAALARTQPQPPSAAQTRAYSSRSRAPAPAPPPTPFVPDVATFLTLIGRGLSQHASKFPTWESLFATTSDQLRELGVEPPRTRRYLVQWRNRFSQGLFGVGGDLRHVVGGRAELRVLETRPGGGEAEAAAKAAAAAAGEKPDHANNNNNNNNTQPFVARRAKHVVNVPPGKRIKDCTADELSRVRGYTVEGARTIVGPYALPMADGKGSVVTVTESMWEMRRGRKIDGGERRRTEVRYKKRIAERREMRERGEL